MNNYPNSGFYAPYFPSQNFYQTPFYKAPTSQPPSFANSISQISLESRYPIQKSDSILIAITNTENKESLLALDKIIDLFPDDFSKGILGTKINKDGKLDVLNETLGEHYNNKVLIKKSDGSFIVIPDHLIAQKATEKLTNQQAQSNNGYRRFKIEIPQKQNKAEESNSRLPDRDNNKLDNDPHHYQTIKMAIEQGETEEPITTKEPITRQTPMENFLDTTVDGLIVPHSHYQAIKEETRESTTPETKVDHRYKPIKILIENQRE